MKKYTVELTIIEGDHEFWEGLQDDGTYRGYATMDEVCDYLKVELEENDIAEVESIKPIKFTVDY